MAHGALKLSALHFRPMDYFVSHIFEINRENYIIFIYNFTSSRSFNLNLFEAWCGRVMNPVASVRKTHKSLISFWQHGIKNTKD